MTRGRQVFLVYLRNSSFVPGWSSTYEFLIQHSSFWCHCCSRWQANGRSGHCLWSLTCSRCSALPQLSLTCPAAAWGFLKFSFENSSSFFSFRPFCRGSWASPCALNRCCLPPFCFGISGHRVRHLDGPASVRSCCTNYKIRSSIMGCWLMAAQTYDRIASGLVIGSLAHPHYLSVFGLFWKSPETTLTSNEGPSCPWSAAFPAGLAQARWHSCQVRFHWWRCQIPRSSQGRRWQCSIGACCSVLTAWAWGWNSDSRCLSVASAGLHYCTRLVARWSSSSCRPPAVISGAAQIPHYLARSFSGDISSIDSCDPAHSG